MPFGLRNVPAKTLATLQDSYKNNPQSVRGWTSQESQRRLWRRLHVRTPLLVDVSKIAKVIYGQSWKNEVGFNDEKSHSFSRDRYNFKL
ncbi:hypothetical protein T09_9514 [Trichinella sp. T9]|nr:hypothetical protein T09_9514 [Trichinella sp. T9]